MQSKTLSVSLTNRGINTLIKELEKEKRKLTLKLWELIDVMCMDGEDYACEYLTHVDTGETLGSIMGYREGNKGIITAGGAAVWIEFGTGTLENGGKSGGDPFHPYRAELGVSDWGTYGKGYGDGSQYPNGWYYFKNGAWHRTTGIAEEPFMANTAERLRDEFMDKVKKVFK